MASRRRRRKSIGKVIVDVERRVRRVEKRPGAKRLKANVVTTEKLGYRAVTTKVIQVDAVNTENVATDAITPNEAAFGTTVVSTTEPTEYLKEGTTWVNPDDGATAVYSAADDAFVEVADVTARTTADGKNTIYSQTSAPTGGTYATDDLWFDTDDGNKVYRWTGTAWVSAQDTAISAAQSAANAAAAAAVTAQAAADAGAAAALVAQNTADGKNKIYRQTTQPSGGTYAAGDTWFDTDGDNAIYRYSSGSSGTVSKKALTGNVATLTTTAAHSFTPGESITVAGVDATFNGTYTVIAAPTTTTLTYAKTATNVTEIASSGTITSTAGWKAIVLGSSAITSISATQISTGTLAAGVIYGGSINANQISTGTIASNIVYAGTVNANQINAGTLAAGVIYSGTINADKINAGTLAAGVIYAGTIAADKITSGTLASGVIYAGYIDADKINAGTISASISLTSATITGGTITGGTFKTAASGTRIELVSTSSNRMTFYGSSSQPGALSVNDYRFFIYAPGTTYGGSSRISLYADDYTLSPNGVFITGGTSLGLSFSLTGTSIVMDQGTYSLRVNANGPSVSGAVAENQTALRNVRITQTAPASGSDSSTYIDGSILLVREA